MAFGIAGIFTGPPIQATPGGEWVCNTESTTTESQYTTIDGTTTYEPYTTLTVPNNPSLTQSGDAEMAPLTFGLDPPYAWFNVNVSEWEGDDFLTVRICLSNLYGRH